MFNERILDVNNLKSDWIIEENNISKRVFILDSSKNVQAVKCCSCGEYIKVKYMTKRKGNKYGIGGRCYECEKLNRKYKHFNIDGEYVKMVYKISFPEYNAIYIGQTSCLYHRMESHKYLAKSMEHSSIFFNWICSEHPEYFYECISNAEIVKVWERDNEQLPYEVLDFEYNLQLESYYKGETVLGRQFGDREFKAWLIGRKGYEAFVEISKKWTSKDDELKEIIGVDWFEYDIHEMQGTQLLKEDNFFN